MDWKKNLIKTIKIPETNANLPSGGTELPSAKKLTYIAIPAAITM